MADASMTLYDMSKQIVSNEPPMDAILFNQKISEVSLDMLTKDYWMLLCRERNDFTVFRTIDGSKKKISKELIPTLHNRGQVIFIDKQKDGAYEIWIRDIKTNENFAYYLFNYSSAVIDCSN
jgi:hypothetical protein